MDAEVLRESNPQAAQAASPSGRSVLRDLLMTSVGD